MSEYNQKDHFQRANYSAFAFTVKKVGREEPEAKDYDGYFELLSKHNITVEVMMPERDRKGRLHYHGIVYIPRGFYRKKICPSNYHVKYVEIWHREQWLRYINKDQHKYEEPDELDVVDTEVDDVDDGGKEYKRMV